MEALVRASGRNDLLPVHQKSLTSHHTGPAGIFQPFNWRMDNVNVDVVVACRLCEEFEVIAERALREVASTEELMEMIDYIEEARTNGMRKLNQRVAVSEL